MIESITISNVATYGQNPEVLTNLSQFNFFFGSNGTGKTTISRVIENASIFPTCHVTWKGGTKQQLMVYNCDFVDRNFNQSDELKGVFTLGEKQKNTLTKIATAKTELDGLTKKIENLTQVLQGTDGTGGKKSELDRLERNLQKQCWAKKQKYDAKFTDAFKGFRNNEQKFKDKILYEFASNSETLLNLEELENKAISLFGSAPEAEQTISPVDATRLLTHETNPILRKKVIGKEDVDIAAMIKKLENSDWVREGRPYYDVNEGVCPFCQQSTTEAFAQSLNQYFDETFLADSKAVDDLVTSYGTNAAQLLQQLATIIATQPKFLDIQKLEAEKKLLESKITVNKQHLAEKKKEVSKIIELEPLDVTIEEINKLINAANTCITDHNKMVANFSKERDTLTAQVWKFVVEELRDNLEPYKTERNNLEKAITSITTQIQAAITDKRRKEAEIQILEKQTTSVQPTVDEINKLLLSFGFQGFSLAVAVDGTSYKLVRPDGSDAKATLSEGEKTFVTFLYFYHLLKGSDSESGITTDRVVVFDDPVSSLDSDILFIVSSLIKRVFEEVRSNTGHIKQVFVLTHNVYFHKEVTFNIKRGKDALNKETFWLVRKSGSVTKIEKQPNNPVTTSYDLLWAELRRSDRSNPIIQNTLRRILENYFKILGGIDPDKICDMFNGKEKLICKSLFSWVNDGSHAVYDDLYVSIDDSQVDNYLNVFRAIFEKSGHSAHYKMMMGEP